MLFNNPQPVPYRYGASYKSTTAMAANTPDAVFAPGSNVNGAIVWIAEFFTHSSANWSTGAGFVAKASAPTSIIDGDVICAINKPASATNTPSSGWLKGPVFIPAGKGLYYINQIADTNCHRAVLYTLL